MVFKISYLEALITKQCNLHCDGCGNYTNYGLKDELSFDQNKEYYRLWSKRIYPDVFRILGGEPTIHKNLIDYINLAFEIWPESKRQLVTNGAFLSRHPGLKDTLRQTNTSILLSFHSNDPKYLESMRPVIAHLKTFKDIDVSFGDYRRFTRLYRGLGSSMLPYEDNNPVESWKNCLANTCKNIWGGRLWKCPPIMGLKGALTHFGIENAPEWAPYLQYDGIGLDSSDEDLKRFLDLGPEGICNMCPKSQSPYYKDVYNVNWQRNVERVEWEGEVIDLASFVSSIESAS